MLPCDGSAVVLMNYVCLCGGFLVFRSSLCRAGKDRTRGLKGAYVALLGPVVNGDCAMEVGCREDVLYFS